MKKAEESKRNSGTLRPGQSAQDFRLSELAKVYNARRKSFSEALSAFFDFRFEAPRPACRIFAHAVGPEPSNFFSVIQLSNNKKERSTSKPLLENFRVNRS